MPYANVSRYSPIAVRNCIDLITYSLKARDAVLAAVCGIVALVLYVRTLIPFLLPLDSGEFQVLVHQLGLAHTTGYSTYLLLGHLFERSVPWGDAAYRTNLFSALMGAVTISLVYLAAVLLGGRRLAALVGALCFAAGFTFWSQAIIAEVYTTGAATSATPARIGWNQNATSTATNPLLTCATTRDSSALNPIDSAAESYTIRDTRSLGPTDTTVRSGRWITCRNA